MKCEQLFIIAQRLTIIVTPFVSLQFYYTDMSPYCRLIKATVVTLLYLTNDKLLSKVLNTFVLNNQH